MSVRVVLLAQAEYERYVDDENDQVGNGEADEELVDVDDVELALAVAVRAVGRVHEGQVERTGHAEHDDEQAGASRYRATTHGGRLER